MGKAERRGGAASTGTAHWTGSRLVIDLGGTCVRFAAVDEQGTVDPTDYGMRPITQSICSRQDLRDLRPEETAAFVERHVRGGALPPDRTNLVGARLFLAQEERRTGG